MGFIAQLSKSFDPSVELSFASSEESPQSKVSSNKNDEFGRFVEKEQVSRNYGSIISSLFIGRSKVFGLGA